MTMPILNETLNATNPTSGLADGNALCTARTHRIGNAAAAVEPRATGEFNVVLEVAMKHDISGYGAWATHKTFAGTDPAIDTFVPSSALFYRFRFVSGVACEVSLG